MSANNTTPASFSSLTVDTLVDNNNGDLSPGDVSLREAIDYVSAGGTINFDSSLENETIVLTQGQLLIDKDLNIEGLGASKLTISGDTSNRIFFVSDGEDTSDLNVLIKGMTLEHASVGVGDFGGAILNLENLELRNSNVRYSDAGSTGGGIANFGSLNIALTTISDNYATVGGGIANFGSLTTSEIAIRDNQASSEGGGIYNENGTVNITQTSIRNNDAFRGGGILNYGGTVSVSHAGIHNNSAEVSGGGVYNTDGGTVYLSQLEVTENTASDLGSGIFNDGNSTLDVSSALFQGNAGEAYGGAIANLGAAFVGTSTIRDGYGDFGGGIHNTGNIVVYYSSIVDNGATVGAGINNNDAGFLYVYSSTISGNGSSDRVTPSFGGGINNDGFANIFDSTISGNGANERGGGISNNGDSSLYLVNSTVSGNTASEFGGLGGGIYNGGNLYAANNTITQNQGEQGGGIFVDSAYSPSPTELISTIVAGNVDSDGSDGSHPDISGDFETTSGFNLIGDGTGSTGLTDGANGNIVGTAGYPIDALLGPLQDNGGFTQTHALLPGSPAIDSGSNPYGLIYDQRGFGFDRLVGDSPDIGAFELQNLPQPIVGDDGNDTLMGTAANDTIEGRGGRDRIHGQGGDDLLFGNQGDDVIVGGSGNDSLYGGQGDDFLRGENQRDFLDGRDGNDRLLGGADEDTLVGGNGNDSLEGRRGEDILYGVKRFDANPGDGEMDSLTGGDSSDRFVLGDTNQAYYDRDGADDFAAISDFNPEDIIQLHGSATDYALVEVSGGTEILFNGSERIAIVENVIDLDLNDPNLFSFV